MFDFRLFIYIFGEYWLILTTRGGAGRDGALRGGAGCPDKQGGAVSRLPTTSSGRGWGTHDPVPIRPVAIPTL